MTDFKDRYKGRQMYPKDTVTRKQMDRQDDRQTRRIDLWKDKHNRLQQRVQKLEIFMVELVKRFSGGSEEE